MTLDVQYHPAALAELRAEIAWYEGRGAGLGDRFETSADDVIDTVMQWPESGAYGRGGTPSR